jgi:hypothetical protein
MAKAFLPFEEARELVRGIGLESQEVREPTPEQSRKKRSWRLSSFCGRVSRGWCATLVSCRRWFASPLATHLSGSSRGGVWASIRERPSSSHRLTCWGTHRASVWVGRGLHSNGMTAAAGCTGGQDPSARPRYRGSHMRCVAQLPPDPTPRECLHAPHV